MRKFWAIFGLLFLVGSLGTACGGGGGKSVTLDSVCAKGAQKYSEKVDFDPAQDFQSKSRCIKGLTGATKKAEENDALPEFLGDIDKCLDQENKEGAQVCLDKMIEEWGARLR